MTPRPIEAISASQPDAVLAGVRVDMMEGGFAEPAVWKIRDWRLGPSQPFDQNDPGGLQSQKTPEV